MALPITRAVARSQLFTNHLHVLAAIAQQPDLRLREIAHQIGITERATQRIIKDLERDGYVTHTRVGARNHYEVHRPVAADRDSPSATRHQMIRLLAADRTPSGCELRAAAFAAAPAALVIADAEGRVIAANLAYCAIVGDEPEELVGTSIRELTHPDHLAGDDHAPGELADGQRPHAVHEKPYVRRDGTTTWVQVRIARTVDPTNGACLFVAEVTDIGDRQRHQQALGEAEERFRGAFDNAPIGMALVAPDGRWLKVNRSLCELTGYSETALLVGSFQSITHPDDLDADLAHVEDLLAGRRRAYEMEKRYYHADGHVIWTLLSVSLVRGADGRPLYFVSQIEDITDRKQRERAPHGSDRAMPIGG